MIVGTVAARAGRDAIACLAVLMAVLAWDLSGADRLVAGLYGGPGGFPLREAWFTRAVMHDGARWLAGLLFCVLAVDACLARPGRAWRLYWLGAVVACLLLVPWLKRHSGTSCPYDLALFGGSVPYVPHWMPGAGDGGPARCFPSGHAITGFAFLPLHFRWRIRRPALAAQVLAVALAAGLACGWAQVARGAHFPSHVFWSGWICWTLGCALAGVADRLHLQDGTRLRGC